MAYGKMPEDNLLGVTDEDFVRAEEDNVSKEVLGIMENFLKSFKSMECAVCTNHFGYQHRQNPNIKLCSTRCLGIANQKLMDNSDFITACNNVVRAIRNADGKEVRMGKPKIYESATSINALGTGTISRGSIYTSRQDLRDLDVGSTEKKVQDDQNSILGAFTTRAFRAVSDGSVCHQELPSVSTCAKSEQPSLGNGNVESDTWKEWLKTGTKTAGEEVLEKPEVVEERASTSNATKSPSNASSVVAETMKTTYDEPKAAAKISEVEVVPPSPELPRAQKLVRPQPLHSLHTVKKTWKLGEMKISPSFDTNNKVMVAFIWKTPKFTINALPDIDKLDAMQAEIQEYHARAPKIARKLTKDDIVFAPYDGELYRGSVCSEDSSGSYKIRFLDFGDTRIVALKDCFEPCAKIMQAHPLYGIVFHLVTKTNQILWMREIKADSALEKIVNTEPLRMETIAKKDDKWSGYLYLENGISVNDTVNELAASYFASASSLKPKPKSSPSRSSETSKFKMPTPEEIEIAAAEAKKAKYPFAKLSRENVDNKAVKSMPYAQNLKNGAKVSVCFVSPTCPCRLHVFAIDDSDEMEKMGAEITKYVESGRNKYTQAPSPNEIVLAAYGEDFFRARVTAVQGDIIDVSFIDFGDRATLKFSECYKPNEFISKFPIFGRGVKLADVPDISTVLHSQEIANAVMELMILRVVNADKDEWIVTLEMEDGRTYNNLVLCAIGQQ